MLREQHTQANLILKKYLKKMIYFHYFGNQIRLRISEVTLTSIKLKATPNICTYSNWLLKTLVNWNEM